MELLERAWRVQPQLNKTLADLHAELEPIWVEARLTSPDDVNAIIPGLKLFMEGRVPDSARDPDFVLAGLLEAYAQLCEDVAKDVARYSPLLAALFLRQALASDYTLAAPDDAWKRGLPVPYIEQFCFRLIKIVDVVRDYFPGATTWLGFDAALVRRTYSLVVNTWRNATESDYLADPVVLEEARSLWHAFGASCGDVDTLLAAEEVTAETSAANLREYNERSMNESSAALIQRLQQDSDAEPQDVAGIRRAKLHVATVRAARAVSHQLRGDWGAARSVARQALEEAFPEERYLGDWTEPTLNDLAELRLASIYVEARHRLHRTPVMDEFADGHLQSFTLAHEADWENVDWPWDTVHFWVEKRLEGSVELPTERAAATGLVRDLIARTVAFGGMYDNTKERLGSDAGRLDSSRTKPKIAEDELAQIQRSIDALHDRLDDPIKSIIEIRDSTDSLLTIVGAASGERKQAADRFLRSAIGKWVALDPQTKKDVYNAELGYRAIMAGDVSDEAARQVASAFGVAFEREQRRNPGLVLPDSSDFTELRNKAAHSEGRFTAKQLEIMRALLLVVGSRGDPLLVRLANAARRPS